MSVPTNGRLVHVACSALLALLLAACGGGDAQPPAAPPETPAQTPADAPAAPAETPTTPPAVTANTVAGTAAPAGPLRITIGQAQAVGITFASSDAQAAANLSVTTNLAALPAGWSSASGTFACASVAQDGACRLDLAYAPLVATPPGTLTLAYSYTDSAGQVKTGSVAVTYEAVPATRAFIADYDGNLVRQCAIAADGSLGSCATAMAAPLFRPTAVAFNGTTAYVLTDGADNIHQCDVDGAGLFTNCRDSGAISMDNPYGLAVHGSFVYVANPGNDTLTWCAIGADGGLGSDCRGSGDALFRGTFNVAFHDGRAYVINTSGNGGSGALVVCDIDEDGAFANCRDTGATLLDRPEGLAIAGTHAYFTNYGSRTVTKCSLGSDGTASACSTVLTTAWSSAGIAISGAHAYITQGSDQSVLHCDVAGDGTFSNCGNAGATGLTYPLGITLR